MRVRHLLMVGLTGLLAVAGCPPDFHDDPELPVVGEVRVAGVVP